MNRGHPSNGGATRDESGLIDIRALMEAARATERTPAAREAEGTPIPVVSNLAVYPFGAPEAAEPAPAPVPEEPPKPRRAGLLNVLLPVIGGAALAGVVAGVLLMRPSQGTQEPTRAGAAGEVAVTAPEAPSPPKIEAVPPPEPATPVEGAAPAESTAVKPPPVKKPPVRTPPVKNAPVKTPPLKKPPVKTPPVKTPPPSPCNGDLRCEMERAVKR